jgi:hypothetical protein
MQFRLPKDPLTKLDPNVEPTPTKVRIIRAELYANARSVRSTLGGGNHGHLGMVMPAAKYLVLAGQAYAQPNGPPPIPAFAGQGAAVAAAQEQYRKDLDAYETFQALYDALKQLIIAAVPPVYLSELEDPTFGLADASPGILLDFLIEEYGDITHEDLEENLRHLQQEWNPETPIQDVFTRGTFCRQFATEGGDPITDTTYMTTLS